MTVLETAVKGLEPATYIVAVSGGVDSMALLHALRLCFAADQLVVAHVDHGIRAESADDARFVEGYCRLHGLQFELGTMNLGEGASEEVARNARYTFLRQIRKKYNAKHIILAHHQDDALETIIHNVQRGTKYRGLCSLRSTDELVRPLLGVPKSGIYDYAMQHNVEWVEDGTNRTDAYTRNRIRRYAVPRLLPERRAKLLLLSKSTQVLCDEVDQILSQWCQNNEISRLLFADLSQSLQAECIAFMLRTARLQYAQKQINEIVRILRSGHKGTKASVQKGVFVVLTEEKVRVLQTS